MRGVLYLLYVYFLDTFIKIINFFKTNKTKKHDLVIVKTDLIGDIVLFFSFLDFIKNNYNGKSIAIVCNNQTKSLLENLYPEFYLYPVNMKVMHTKKRLGEIAQLLNIEANELVYPVYSREFFSGDSLVRLMKAKRKIGFNGECSNISRLQMKICNLNYDKVYELDNVSKMEIDRNMEILSKYTGQKITRCLPEIKTYKAQRENTAIMAIGGSWSGKKWPLERFIELSKYIKEEIGLNPVFCGTMSDVTREELLAIEQSGFDSLIGKTTLPELLSEIAKSKLVVCNDSSTLHFASAMKTPAVSFVGGGHFGRFAPWVEASSINQYVLNYEMECYHCLWSCPYVQNKDQLLPCIDKISTKVAKEKIADLLAKGLFK